MCFRHILTALTPHAKQRLQSPMAPQTSFISGPILLPVASTGVVDALLREDDYPEVLFWRKWAWMKHKESKDSTDIVKHRSRDTTDEELNKTMGYAETAKGTKVGGVQAKAMRRHAQGIWHTYGHLDLAPPKWGKATMDVRREYLKEMRQKFPELALCENDWKADQIVTDNYPSWYTNYKKGNKVKQEIQDDEPLIQLNSNRKQPLSTESSAATAKKLKSSLDANIMGSTWASMKVNCYPSYPFELPNCLSDI